LDLASTSEIDLRTSDRTESSSASTCPFHTAGSTEAEEELDETEIDHEIGEEEEEEEVCPPDATNNEEDDEPFNDDGSTDDNESLSDESPYVCYRKSVIGLMLLTIVLFVVVDSVFGKMYIRQGITVFLEWNHEHPGTGAMAFAAVYFVATIFCVPGALLTLGAGFVFSASFDGSLVVGVFLGTLTVFVAAFASSIVAFVLARYLLYENVRGLSQKYSIFEALDIALSEKGFRIMCLLRLSPITPFVLLNYIAGVTTVQFSSYCLATFCILPGTILYVFLGASAGSLTDKTDNTTVTIAVIVVGVVFGVLAIALTSHYARKELNKEVDLVRSRQYERATSRRRRLGYKRSIERRRRSRYRRNIDRKRAKGSL